MEQIKNFVAKQRWVSVFVATIALGIVLSFLSPAFLNLNNFENIILQASVSGIMAIGMSFIIMAGGIDISVGAILFFTGSLFAQMINTGINIYLAMAITIISATLLGTLNGILVVYTNIAPFIVTLATYNVYRGLALRITNAGNIPVSGDARVLGVYKVFGEIPLPIVILIVIMLLGLFLAKYTRFGVYTRAIGNSKVSAKESSLPVNKTQILVYMLGGFTSGIAALILIGRIGGLQSGMGIGLEFSVIAAVVLGGTKLSGGSGSIVGSVLGAIFLLIITNGLNLIKADAFIYEIVTGAVLVVAVLVDRISVMRQEKALMVAKQKRILKA